MNVSAADRDPVMIMVAPNGARRNKADHPALPMTPAELAQCADDCRRAGAGAIHLHVRDDEGRHSLDADRYRQAIAAIRDRVGDDMLIQVTTEAVGRYRPDEQMALLRELRPQAASLAIREVLPQGASAREVGEVAAFLHEMHDAGVLIQYILYDGDDLRRLAVLHGEGRIPQRWPWMLFVLGRYAQDRQSAPGDLMPFLRELEKTGLRDAPWSVCAFGVNEFICAVNAVALGGGVRVGFENNLLLADGTGAPDNAANVAQVAAAVRKMGRQTASAGQILERLSQLA